MAAKRSGDKSALQAAEAKRNGKLLGSMLDVFIRGKDKGDRLVRASRLIQTLWDLALHSEKEAVRLEAARELWNRIDGKVVERKEIANVRIEGLVYLPPSREIKPEPLEELEAVLK
jgi:hypothetical protein